MPNEMGCQCIMLFDKQQILKALDWAIERQEFAIKKIHKRKEEIIRNELLTPEELTSIYERFKRDFQIVRKRTDDTPICKI